MAGRPGRGGQNKIPIEEHIKRGTYRPYRHGPRLAAERGGALVWRPEPKDLEGLGEAGQAFLTETLQTFDVPGFGGLLVLQAARCLDELEVWQQQAQTNPAAERLVLQIRGRFAMLVGQVRLQPVQAGAETGWPKVAG